MLRTKAPFTFAVAACLFFLIVGAKWAVFDQFGSPMPDWDQWDAEAMGVLVPWYEHDQFLPRLFQPHNEHRVVLTKLQSLALVMLNGQWDARLEAATNALLHAAIGVGFWIFGRRTLAAGWHAALFVTIAVLFGLPLAWENVLGGFHSQQFWLLGLSFAAIVLLPFSRPGAATWWVGLLAAVLALGSMGSGFLAAVAIVGVIGWRVAQKETTLREAAPTLALMAIAIAVGALSRVEVPGHAHLKATTIHDFVFSLLHSLQWPWRTHSWVAAVLWLPWACAAWRLVSGPEEAGTRRNLTIVALGAWVLLQMAATAYARGAGGDYPASRYMDTLVFGTLVNALTLLRWLGKPPSRTYPLFAYAVALSWFVTLGGGIFLRMRDVVPTELAGAKAYYLKSERHLRGYLATDDPGELAYPDIPFPSAPELIARLARPRLRALMAPPVRAPLTIAPAAASPAFRANDARRSAPENPPRNGLSPALAPLETARSWGSFGPGAAGTGVTGEWTSQPLVPSGFGWLQFETAGHLGEPGVALELRAAAGGTLLATVVPDRVPGDTWRTAYVRAPRIPYVIVARDADPARWLAFSGPTEMGQLSYWAWRLTKSGVLIVDLAATASIVLGLAARMGRPRALF